MDSSKQLLLIIVIIGTSILVDSNIIEGEDGKKLILHKLQSADGKLFSLKVTINFEPPVEVNLLLDTGGHRTWIANREIPRKNWLQLGDYRWGPRQYKLGNGWAVDGDLIEGQLDISGVTFPRRTLMVVKQMTDIDNKLDWQQFEYDGILALSSLGDIIYRYMPEMVVDPETGVDRSIFSLYFNGSAAVEAEQSATLILGGTDKRFYAGRIHYVPNSAARPTKLISVTRDPKGRERFDSVDTINCGQSRRAIFDSTSRFIQGDPEVTDSLMNKLGATKLLDSYYAISCDLSDKPNIVFKVGDEQENYEFVLEPKDYVTKLDSVESSASCIASIRAYRSKDLTIGGGNYFPWSFGTIAMRNYYMIFDQMNRRIGFAVPTV